MKFAGRIKIKDGHIKYIDDFPGMVNQIKNDKKYQNREGEIMIEFKEQDVEYYQHKYYRGFLLPDIADTAFDGKKRRAHIEMKRMFLYFDVNNEDDIPAKHFGRCILDYERYKLADGKIVHNLRGYMPSMGDITKKEAKEFILKVENFAFTDLQIGYEKGSEAAVTRQKGLEQEDEENLYTAEEMFSNNEF